LAAQELAGRIEGTVTDQQGAVVPSARVTIHIGASFVYRASSTAAGRFAMPAVRRERRLGRSRQAQRRAPRPPASGRLLRAHSESESDKLRWANARLMQFALKVNF